MTTKGRHREASCEALGLRACVQGVSLRFARCVNLLADLQAELADNTYPMRLKAWAHPDLLIVDNMGLGQVRQRDDEPSSGAPPLADLVDRRHGRLSTAVACTASTCASGAPSLGDATVAAAILDRLAMHAIRRPPGPHQATDSTSPPCVPGDEPETRTTDGRTDTRHLDSLTQKAALSARRRATTLVPPPSPTVPDVEAAPELAAIILLEHALDVVGNALLISTLLTTSTQPSEEGALLSLAILSAAVPQPCWTCADATGRPPDSACLDGPDRRPWRRQCPSD